MALASTTAGTRRFRFRHCQIAIEIAVRASVDLDGLARHVECSCGVERLSCAGLSLRIHVLLPFGWRKQDVDGRDFRREDGASRLSRPAMTVVCVRAQVRAYFFSDVLELLRGSSAGLT